MILNFNTIVEQARMKAVQSHWKINFGIWEGQAISSDRSYWIHQKAFQPYPVVVLKLTHLKFYEILKMCTFFDEFLFLVESNIFSF